MTDISFLPAVEIARMIREKEIGCVEALEHFLARVDRFNPALNAIIVLDREGARDRAREADNALARGEVWGPLHGVPMTIKESYDVAGMPTTWGLPEFAQSIAEEDALSVKRLKAAGVTLFGKTNVPVLLSDWQSFNPIYGTTNNPWDLGRTPGGSSGGSAAALAAGLTGLDAGSDIGASIRNPAHYCGLFGHKPTWGVISPYGHTLNGVVTPTDISCIGPLARSADDLEVAMDAMAGGDPLSDAGWRLDLPQPRTRALSEMRIAVMLTDKNCAQDDALTDALQGTVDALAKAGASISDTARPDIDTTESHEIYTQLLRAATGARVADAVFEQHRANAAASDPSDRSYKTLVDRSVTITHRDWIALDEARNKMRYKWAAFFEDWDVLLCPTAASAAFPHDQEGERVDRTIPVNGKPESTIDQLFWAGWPGVSLLPGTVAPSGLTKDGLPCGIQIIGGHLQDRTTIQMARLIEKHANRFTPPPGY